MRILVISSMIWFGALSVNAQEADIYLEWAHCLGGSDSAAQIAAQYGYDLKKHNQSIELAMKKLKASSPSHTLQDLEHARLRGKSRHKKLIAMLQGRMEGNAWDKYVDFTIGCDEVKAHITALGN